LHEFPVQCKQTVREFEEAVARALRKAVDVKVG